VDRELGKFFDRVNHDALRARGARTVRDKARRRLSGQDRRAGVVVGENLQPTATGVPQGSPLTPPTILPNGR
jgi:RNA-directed DNA polymerase